MNASVEQADLRVLVKSGEFPAGEWDKHQGSATHILLRLEFPERIGHLDRPGLQVAIWRGAGWCNEWEASVVGDLFDLRDSHGYYYRLSEEDETARLQLSHPRRGEVEQDRLIWPEDPDAAFRRLAELALPIINTSQANCNYWLILRHLLLKVRDACWRTRGTHLDATMKAVREDVEQTARRCGITLPKLEPR